MSLWYVTIIFPALGTGLIITIESWIAAYRQHSLMNIGVAAYNTLAQVHNTMGAINGLGPAFQAVGKLFASVAKGRGDAKGKAAILGAMIAIAVVVIALSAGVLLTAVLIHRYAGTVPLAGRRRRNGAADRLSRARRQGFAPDALGERFGQICVA